VKGMTHNISEINQIIENKLLVDFLVDLLETGPKRYSEPSQPYENITKMGYIERGESDDGDGGVLIEYSLTEFSRDVAIIAKGRLVEEKYSSL
jgi:hypothetical protein